MSDLHSRIRERIQKTALRGRALSKKRKTCSQEGLADDRHAASSRVNSAGHVQPMRRKLAAKLRGPSGKRAGVAGGAHLRRIERNVMLDGRAKGLASQGRGRLRKQHLPPAG